MPNEVTVQTEANKVTQKLLYEYLSTLTTSLTEGERVQFLAIAQAFNLNPFKREIYAVKYGNSFNVITGYEVYIKRAESFPQYDGYETEFGIDAAKQVFCTCRVFRKDRSHACTSTVYMAEYNTGKSLWLSKPKVMLEKVAIATAFRRAFPSEFNGMPYTSDEMPEPTATLDPKNEIPQAEKPAKRSFSEVIADERSRVGEEAFNKLLFDFGCTKLSEITKELQEGFYRQIAALPTQVSPQKEESVEDVKIFNDEPMN
ncbi:MAG: phage recombination protein Bet [Fibrobacter sp.]|nr:phage recombination protein Bet [Fibrobacter sp.]